MQVRPIAALLLGIVSACTEEAAAGEDPVDASGKWSCCGAWETFAARLAGRARTGFTDCARDADCTEWQPGLVCEQGEHEVRSCPQRLFLSQESKTHRPGHRTCRRTYAQVPRSRRAAAVWQPRAARNRNPFAAWKVAVAKTQLLTADR